MQPSSVNMLQSWLLNTQLVSLHVQEQGKQGSQILYIYLSTNAKEQNQQTDPHSAKLLTKVVCFLNNTTESTLL